METVTISFYNRLLKKEGGNPPSFLSDFHDKNHSITFNAFGQIDRRIASDGSGIAASAGSNGNTVRMRENIKGNIVFMTTCG